MCLINIGTLAECKDAPKRECYSIFAVFVKKSKGQPRQKPLSIVRMNRTYKGNRKTSGDQNNDTETSPTVGVTKNVRVVGQKIAKRGKRERELGRSVGERREKRMPKKKLDRPQARRAQ